MSLFRRVPTSSVANLTALAAEPVGVRKDGFLVYVKSLRSYFALERVSTLTADGINVIAGRGLAGSAWVRFAQAHPYWATVGDWYINATTGNDENDGTVAPLKTWAELARRWGRSANLAPPVNLGTYRVCRVHIPVSLPVTDPLHGDPVLNDNVYLYIIGGPETVLQTGTSTAVTVKAPATNVPLQVTDTALAAANSWTALVGKRVRLTSGANAGSLGWVAKDQGTKQARASDVSLCPQMDPANAAFILAVTGYGGPGNSHPPAVGDTYAVEQLVTVTVGELAPRFNTQNTRCLFGELTFRGSSSLVAHGNYLSNPFIFYSCSFLNPPSPSVWGAYMNCCFNNGIYAASGAEIQVYSGLVLGLVGIASLNGSVVLDNDVMIQGAGIRGGNVRISAACVFDSTNNGSYPGGHGLHVGGAPVSTKKNLNPCTIGVGNYGASSRLWGAGNAGGGVAVEAGAVLYCPSALLPNITITGSTPGTNDLMLAGKTTARAWDENAGAFTAARTTSWTNLNAAIGSGGFGGNAQDVATGARIASAA